MAIKIVLLVVVFLWLFGFINVPLLNITLFSLFGHPITLRMILLIGLIGYLINFLPGVLKTIAIVLFVLWLLSQFVFPVFGGIAQIFVLLIILAIVFSFF